MKFKQEKEAKDQADCIDRAKGKVIKFLGSQNQGVISDTLNKLEATKVSFGKIKKVIEEHK